MVTKQQDCQSAQAASLPSDHATLIACQQKFLKILDGLKAIVYVADMQSYEVIYINQYTRDIFGDIEWEADKA